MNNNDNTAGAETPKTPKAGDCAAGAGICFLLALATYSCAVIGTAITLAILFTGLGCLCVAALLGVLCARRTGKPARPATEAPRTLTPAPSWDRDNFEGPVS